jgi:hypothetical protein
MAMSVFYATNVLVDSYGAYVAYAHLGINAIVTPWKQQVASAIPLRRYVAVTGDGSRRGTCARADASAAKCTELK